MCNREKYQFEIDLPKHLLLKKTEHFNIYYYPASVAEKEIDAIAAQREKAYSDIAVYLNTSINICVDLYLFNDGETKEKETKHKGAGWAFDTVMVEIYNEAVKCHPYHELVHIFADFIYGATISFLSEGLAVFVSESAYDCEIDGYVNYSTHEKVKQLNQNDELFRVKELFSFQIGESASRPKVSYPQAASLVKYLFGRLGNDGFFELYRNLNDGYSDEEIAININEFEKICGISAGQVNEEWLNTIT